MKVKKTIVLLPGVLLLALLFLILPVSAASLPRMIDETGHLTSGEVRLLEEKLDSLSEEYQCDVVALMVETTSWKTAEQYADDFFDYQGYGLGPERSGILFLVSLKDRAWHFSTSGDGIDIFKHSRLEKMGDRIPPLLSSGDYYGAFDLYADQCAAYLKDPEDRALQNRLMLVRIIAAVGIGGVLGFGATALLKMQLKSTGLKSQAADYVIPGSFHVNRKEDLFLYSTLSKIARPKDTGGGGSGGGHTHRSSSGRSHGGHGGRF